ncbi:MAG: hypothetical protein PVI90_07440, partial [Desulfobacteraceae bacterium]
CQAYIEELEKFNRLFIRHPNIKSNAPVKASLSHQKYDGQNELPVNYNLKTPEDIVLEIIQLASI